jgi:hypothetical protein
MVPVTLDELEAECQAIGNLVLRAAFIASLRSAGRDVRTDVAAAFTRRALALWKAARFLLDGPSEAAVHVLLRALAEAGITLAWLMQDAANIEVWMADDRRQKRRLLDRAQLAGITGLLDPPEVEALGVMRAELEEPAPADPDAKLADRLPPLDQRAKAAGEEHILAIYDLSYPVLSNWTHASAGSFTQEESAPHNRDGFRREGITLLLTVVRQAGLAMGANVEQRCEAAALAVDDAE